VSLDDYARSQKRRSGPRCSVCALPPALLGELQDAVGRHSHQTMSDYLRNDHGITVSYWSIGHHFRQGHKMEVA
jgi:hypothetical protein